MHKGYIGFTDEVGGWVNQAAANRSGLGIVFPQLDSARLRLKELRLRLDSDPQN